MSVIIIFVCVYTLLQVIKMIRMQIDNEENMPDKKEHISLSRFTVYHSAEDLSRSEHENDFKEEPGDSCGLMNEATAKSGHCNKVSLSFLFFSRQFLFFQLTPCLKILPGNIVSM